MRAAEAEKPDIVKSVNTYLEAHGVIEAAKAGIIICQILGINRSSQEDFDSQYRWDLRVKLESFDQRCIRILEEMRANGQIRKQGRDRPGPRGDSNNRRATYWSIPAWDKAAADEHQRKLDQSLLDTRWEIIRSHLRDFGVYMSDDHTISADNWEYLIGRLDDK